MNKIEALQREIDYLLNDKIIINGRLEKAEKDDVKLFLQNVLNNIEENISSLEEKKNEILNRNT